MMGVILMGRTNTKSKTMYNEYSYARYALRIRKDLILYDDVEDFMRKKHTSLNGLATKLLDDYFFKLRYSDPEYPQ
jgi:hypothetical protein